jgi:hypothetical protein
MSMRVERSDLSPRVSEVFKPGDVPHALFERVRKSAEDAGRDRADSHKERL